MKIFKKDINKETTKLPMQGKVGMGYRTYCALVLALCSGRSFDGY